MAKKWATKSSLFLKLNKRATTHQLIRRHANANALPTWTCTLFNALNVDQIKLQAFIVIVKSNHNYNNLIDFFFSFHSICARSHYRKARRKEKDGDQNSNDTKLYLEESVLERKLTDANLNTIVELPAGLDYNEWLASHSTYLSIFNITVEIRLSLINDFVCHPFILIVALALFEHVNLVYGTISEFCTTSGCPDMTGPGNRYAFGYSFSSLYSRITYAVI